MPTNKDNLIFFFLYKKEDKKAKEKASILIENAKGKIIKKTSLVYIILKKVLYSKYFLNNSIIKNLYSASALSSASIKHKGGNKTHHQLSPKPSPKTTNKDS